MNVSPPALLALFLLSVSLAGYCAAPAQAYITAPVATLGAAVSDSTYVTVVRVEKVNREKGMIVYTKVADLKGKYPKDSVTHVFDLKGTPAHKGSGDVPVRPDEKDWKYAIDWAQPGKIAVMFTRQYEPFGDFGHTYIDGCWYATMCPPRDWQFWYAIYADSNLLTRWHAGTPERLAKSLESVVAGRDGIVPALAGGTKDELRAGRAKVQGLRAAIALRDYNPGRDLVTGPVDAAAVPELIKTLESNSRDEKVRALRALGLFSAEAKAALPALASAIREDLSGTVRITAAETLLMLGPEAKSALPAIEAGLADPRMAPRADVRAKLIEVRDKLK